MRRKAFISLGLVSLLSLLAVPVYANGVPELPHAFYGTVTVNGASAGDGTQISAMVAEGEVLTTSQNPVGTVNGNYGIDGLHLLVQGDIPDGATITFYVNGSSTYQTTTFVAGGGPTPMNLTVSIPGPGAGGFAPAPAPDIESNLFGTETEFSISEDGEIQERIEATSEAGDLTIVIEEGTIALDEDGEPLESLEITVDESSPDPPEDAHIIGLSFDFGPAGATFDPPLIMAYTLDLDDLPEGIAPEDLVIAYWDGDEWVELDSDVDVENNTITIEADVDHFTTFAVIGRVAPAEAPPEEAAPPAEAVPPPEVPPAAPPPEAPPVNWTIWGPIIGVAVFLAIFLPIRLRRRRRFG